MQGFCIAIIRSFRRSSIVSNDAGTGASQKSLEGQYQNEIYRATSEILGSPSHLSSEWSPAGLSGRVDFQVRSMKWSIECLRQGDRLYKHIARFQEGGRYFEWIEKGYVNDYILIDFRNTEPPLIKCKFSRIKTVWRIFLSFYRPGAISHFCCVRQGLLLVYHL